MCAGRLTHSTCGKHAAARAVPPGTGRGISQGVRLCISDDGGHRETSVEDYGDGSEAASHSSGSSLWFADLLSQLDDSLRQQVDCLSTSGSSVSFHALGAGCIVNSRRGA